MKSEKEHQKAKSSIQDTTVQPDLIQDIAIIGINGKYPKAGNLNEFWNNLRQGLHCITEIPPDRWNVEHFFDKSRKPGKSYNKWGGFIDDVDKFEAQFFHISPKEAETMDPQQRIFMEIVWGLFEDAGYTPSSCSRNTGVFVGVVASDYNFYLTEGSIQGGAYYRNSDYFQIPNRVSYFFNFDGPSLAVDTGCSSSGVALHLACQSIRLRECKTAVVGGLNLFLNPSRFIQYSQMKIFAPDNTCKPFSDEANGPVMSEGIGAVLLKPLIDAQKDGDYIYAVIKASAINSGGKTDGFTVPNPLAQANMISNALKQSKIDARTISYMETHGSGTSLGDPIEIQGLTKAYKDNISFDEYKNDVQYCSIGSVKSNIGHVQSGAAISGLMKIVLQLKHKQLVPSLFATKPNHLIPFNESPFFIQQKNEEWKRPELVINGNKIKFPRRAGLSSFGEGGTNSHFIVEEYNVEPKKSINRSPQVMVFSSKSKEKLELLCEQFADYAEEVLKNDITKNIYSFRDIAFTLQLGRVEMEERLAFIASDIDEAIEILRQYLKKEPNTNIFRGNTANSIPSETFFEGREGDEYLNIIIQDKKYEKLAKLWASGLNIKWNFLYNENRIYRRVPLPGYQFKGERYMLPNFGDPLTDTKTIKTPDIQESKLQERQSPNLSNKQFQIETSINEKFNNDLLNIIINILKIDKSKISLTENIDKYGFDSITFTELADILNTKYNLGITPDIFYGHTTIESLASYILQAYSEQLSKYFFKLLRETNLPIAQQIDIEPKDTYGTRIEMDPFVEEECVSYKAPITVNTCEPVAIIGMSGVMPQSPDLETFWQHLVKGNSLISEIPNERWNWKSYTERVKGEGKTALKWGAFINDIDKFDPLFFNISPKEAEDMDPQLRIFMQTTWKAIEDSGYNPSELSGSNTGVFVGVTSNDYNILFNTQQPGTVAQFHFMIANRISFQLNLHGPSESIDTGCSSSLVAINRAVESIHSGNCDMAIAGGVNALLHPNLYLWTANLSMLSKDGRCFTFDKRANGYVRGEGAGALLLKPLSKAQKDGDFIYAVIKGNAVNHSGVTSSPTTPNPTAQAELIRKAHEKAQIDPSTVSYIETHGTGTSLGDPIEINGLKKAFGELYKKWQISSNGKHIALGALKTNIGHLESAAGVAGIIKVLLSMQNRLIPGNINFEEQNPYIKLDDSPFYIMKESVPWKHILDRQGNEIPYRAGVSSFGAGGSNAHIVLEESPLKHVVNTPNTDMQIIILSARKKEQLLQIVTDLATHIKHRYIESPSTNKLSVDVNPMLQNTLLYFASEIIHVDQKKVDVNENLCEYGFDKMQMAEFSSKINDHFSINDTSWLIDNNLTINSISTHLANKFKEELIRHFNIDATIIDQLIGKQQFSLQDIAFTLQVGRKPQKVRLALLVKDYVDLYRLLTEFINNPESARNIHFNNGDNNSILLKKTLSNEMVSALIDNKEFDKLTKLWVDGNEINWNLLHKNRKPLRVPLPTYPFCKDRYWINKLPDNITTNSNNLEISVPTGIKPQEVPITMKTTLTDQAVILSIKEIIENDLIELLNAILKMKKEDIELNTSLLDYGFNSISLTEFVSKIRENYTIEMPIQSFFDLDPPTVNTLCNYLLDQHGQHLMSLLNVTTDNLTNKKLRDDKLANSAKVTPFITSKVIDYKYVNFIEIKQKVEDEILGIAKENLIYGKEGYEKNSIKNFLNHLNTQYDLQVSEDKFIDHPSIGAFVNYLTKKYKNKFENHFS